MVKMKKKQDFECIDRERLDVGEKMNWKWIKREEGWSQGMTFFLNVMEQAYIKQVWYEVATFISIYLIVQIRIFDWCYFFRVYKLSWYVPLCAFHRHMGLHLLAQEEINYFSIFLNHIYIYFLFLLFKICQVTKHALWLPMSCSGNLRNVHQWPWQRLMPITAMERRVLVMSGWRRIGTTHVHVCLYMCVCVCLHSKHFEEHLETHSFSFSGYWIEIFSTGRDMERGRVLQEILPSGIFPLMPWFRN